MKISETTNIDSQFVQQCSVNNKAAPEPDTHRSGNVAPEEKVSLSATAQNLQKVANAVEELPDVREERIQEIKTQIEQGTYEINSGKIADKMLSESLIDVMA